MATVRKAKLVSAPGSSAGSTSSNLRACCDERFGINNYCFLNLWMIMVTMMNCIYQSTSSSAPYCSLDSQRLVGSLGKHSFSSFRRSDSFSHGRRRSSRSRYHYDDPGDNDDSCVVLASASSSATSLPPLFWNEGIVPVESIPHKKKKVSAKHKKKSHGRPHLPKMPARHHAAVSEEDAAAKAAAALVESLTQPLISDSVWHSLSGTEFRDNADKLLEPLATMGERLTMHDDINNEWIEWSLHDKSAMDKPLEDGVIRLWTGRCKKMQQPQAATTSAAPYYGSDLPFIKSQSIVPLSVDELVDLLLDSARIQSYNKWSLGRRDCWVRDAYTKIVKNRVHAVSKTMISTTLLHARPATTTVSGDGAWVVVSRAVGGHAYAEPDDAKAGRSDILLGCNVLQPIDGDDESCLLTAVTHVYSSTVPKLMAERLGVKGAINFVKDLRKLKVAVAE